MKIIQLDKTIHGQFSLVQGTWSFLWKFQTIININSEFLTPHIFQVEKVLAQQAGFMYPLIQFPRDSQENIQKSHSSLFASFIGKMVGDPWDVTLFHQPHIHLVYWLPIPFKGLQQGVLNSQHTIPKGPPSFFLMTLVSRTVANAARNWSSSSCLGRTWSGTTQQISFFVVFAFVGKGTKITMNNPG